MRLKTPILTYLNHSFLPFNPRLNTILPNLHIEILALEVSRHFNRDFEVGDGLGPFVRERALLFLLFGFGGFVEALALGGRG